MSARNALSFFVLAAAGFVLYVAYRTRPVKNTRRRWKRFDEANPLDATACSQLQGIYNIGEGDDFFGQSAVAKWSYTVEKTSTVYHLSFFCEKDGLYIICEGKRENDSILFFGYWRKAAATGTGTVELILEDADRIVERGYKTFYLKGHYGKGDAVPKKPMSLHYKTRLPKKPPFDILAHRGGARNIDFLPVSENTCEMMKMAARLGATGVEIDVRLTKDGVPVIFHDRFLSVHTVKGNWYSGILHNYTLEELKEITLRKGGQVPTLEECLHTILYNTPLEIVWLDVKRECDFTEICRLQMEYRAKAEEVGRRLEIYIGIPNKKIMGCFKKMPGYLEMPSIVEMAPKYVHELNAEVWAPQYTNGAQKEVVAAMQATGKKVYVWSLDNKLMIDYFISEGGFDGLITNAPSVVAHWYYTSANNAQSIMKEHPFLFSKINRMVLAFNKVI